MPGKDMLGRDASHRSSDPPTMILGQDQALAFNQQGEMPAVRLDEGSSSPGRIQLADPNKLWNPTNGDKTGDYKSFQRGVME